MKHLLSIISLWLGLGAPSRPPEPTVTVYAYDTFTATGSLGPVLAETVLTKYGIRTKYVGFSSAGEALNQIALEGDHTHADIVVGIDNTWVERARELHAFAAAAPELWQSVPPELRFDPEGCFVPFDYGYVSVIYDSARGTTVPAAVSLRDLARDPRFRKRLIVEDPRTSSLGLAFLTWTHAVFGDQEFGHFWEALAPAIVTVAPGWSGAYALFLRREADFVVTYTTSPAYHIAVEHKRSFRAMVFEEGNLRQVESAALVRYSQQSAQARTWLGELLSPEIQARLPALQWMYPVRSGIDLPSSFLALPKVKKALVVTPSPSDTRQWLREWTLRMAGVSTPPRSPRVSKPPLPETR